MFQILFFDLLVYLKKLKNLVRICLFYVYFMFHNEIEKNMRERERERERDEDFFDDNNHKQ